MITYFDDMTFQFHYKQYQGWPPQEIVLYSYTEKSVLITYNKITFFEGHFLAAKGLCYIIVQNKSPNLVHFALNSFCQGDTKAML